MNLEAFVLGCGGMMPLPYRHLTSVLLRRDGDLFLFDCGEGTQVSLKRLNLKWKKIDAIFISHTHADHVTGLPGMLMLSAQVDRTEPLYIYGPPKVKEYVETSRQVLDMYINYPIIIKEITAPCVVHEGKDFYIRAFPLSHTKTCVGYTLEELDRPGEFNPEKAKELGAKKALLACDRNLGEEAYAKIKGSLEAAGVDYGSYIFRERAEDELFPWDYVDCGVKKEWLLHEWQQARAEVTTSNCRDKCSGCGCASYQCGICVKKR